MMGLPSADNVTVEKYESYRARMIDDLLLSIRPIWKMIDQIELDYQEALAVGGPGSCHPMSEQAWNWHRNSDSKRTSLNAAGLALVHVVDIFFKGILKDHRDTFGMQGPNFRNGWTSAILAAGNFCRHGDVWYASVKGEILKRFSKKVGRYTSISLSDDSLREQICPLLKREPKQNIDSLINFGFGPIELLIDSPSFYGVAKRLGLCTEKKLMQNLNKFFKHLHSQLGKKLIS